jgi:predicted transcriptional regulator of viral defense system
MAPMLPPTPPTPPTPPSPSSPSRRSGTGSAGIGSEVHPSLDALAATRAGIVSRTELLANGWSPSAITRATSRGRLVAVTRGVYRTAGSPWTRRAAQHAVIALLGADAVLSRWTAAELLGIHDVVGGAMHATIPHRRRLPRGVEALVRVTRTTSDLTEARRNVHGLPITDGASTVIDLAAHVTESRLTELAAAALRRRVTTLRELRQRLDTHTRAPGRARLLAVIDLLADDAGRTRSDVEMVACHAIVDAGLPRPVLAHHVRDGQGRLVAELDLAYPEQRIAIEVDGYRWHSSPARKRADEERQNRLVVLGWTVLRFSATDVRTRPHHVVAMVAAALERSGASVSTT